MRYGLDLCARDVSVDVGVSQNDGPLNWLVSFWFAFKSQHMEGVSQTGAPFGWCKVNQKKGEVKGTPMRHRLGVRKRP